MNLTYFVARDLHMGTCSELQVGRLVGMKVDLMAAVESDLNCI